MPIIANVNRRTGKITASVSSDLTAKVPTSGTWLLRVPNPRGNAFIGGPVIYAKEVELLRVYKNTGKFRYTNGTTLSVNLVSDALIARLFKSTGYEDVFPISLVQPSNVMAWNERADFRVVEPSVYSFDGVELEALRVFDFRPSYGTPVYYPKYPRFQVGDIVMTDFKPDDSVAGIQYGYARIERITEEYQSIGAESVPLLMYTIRRSWKGISTEAWNQFSKVIDQCPEGKEPTMRTLPASVQSNMRTILFDPFYR